MKAAHPEVAAGSRVNPGDTLRQAREGKAWSLPEVAARLNLTPASLANLEAGAFDKLPGHTFSRGYIRAYAKLLGLDQAVLVQAFDQYTGTNAQGSNVHGLGRIEEPSRLAHNLLRIVSLMLVLALVGGGFLWWQDKTTTRGTDPTNVALEHVEVESADGTTQIHPLDEPEDQAVVAAREGEPTALSLGQGQTPVDPATTGTPATTTTQPSATVAQTPATVATPVPAPVPNSATTPAAPAPVATPAPVEAPARPRAPRLAQASRQGAPAARRPATSAATAGSSHPVARVPEPERPAARDRSDGSAAYPQAASVVVQERASVRRTPAAGSIRDAPAPSPGHRRTPRPRSARPRRHRHAG